MRIIDILSDGGATGESRHYECRDCGTNLSKKTEECPECGGGVAVYVF